MKIAYTDIIEAAPPKIKGYIYPENLTTRVGWADFVDLNDCDRWECASASKPHEWLLGYEMKQAAGALSLLGLSMIAATRWIP